MHLTDDFAESVCRLELLEPGQRDEFERLRARSRSPQALAGKLYRRGWLTPMQLRWLARGQGHRLVLGPYVLLDRMGRGGMAEVFKARHRRLGRLAAVKTVRPDKRGDPRVVERFLREVRAVARLDHPHVAHAYDAGKAGRTYFLAVEYAEGPDLRRLLQENGPLEPAQACWFARQAALGLAHLHGRGLVHRDVKPSNLALSRDGVIKVLDVGLARAGAWALGAAEAAGLTRAGSLVGTADYVAPEQVEDPRRADGRSDLYALGCTLYHLLSGRVPFPEGTPVQKALRHLSEQPEPLAQVRPGLPPALLHAVGRLMAKRPAERYADALEAADVLAAAATSPAAA